MSTQPKTRPKRRSEIYEDPNQFLWAISYADLLMVLMSFFVIFFQISDEKTAPKSDSPIFKLADTLKKGGDLAVAVAVAPPASQLVEGAAVPGQATNTPSTGGVTPTSVATANTAPIPNAAASIPAAPVPVATPPEAITQKPNTILASLGSGLALSKVKFVTDTVTRSIIVQLRDDLYQKGQFQVTSRARSELETIFAAMWPLRSEIVLTFIGHTDEIPVAHLGKVIDSNLILSNLRAAKAVEFAVRAGFEPKWVSSEGVGEQGRKTRSLSIRVTERPK